MPFKSSCQIWLLNENVAFLGRRRQKSFSETAVNVVLLALVTHPDAPQLLNPLCGALEICWIKRGYSIDRDS